MNVPILCVPIFGDTTGETTTRWPAAKSPRSVEILFANPNGHGTYSPNRALPGAVRPPVRRRSQRLPPWCGCLRPNRRPRPPGRRPVPPHRPRQEHPSNRGAGTAPTALSNQPCATLGTPRPTQPQHQAPPPVIPFVRHVLPTPLAKLPDSSWGSPRNREHRGHDRGLAGGQGGHLLIQSGLDHGLGQRLEQTLRARQVDATCPGLAHQLPRSLQLLRRGLL